MDRCINVHICIINKMGFIDMHQQYSKLNNYIKECNIFNYKEEVREQTNK